MNFLMLDSEGPVSATLVGGVKIVPKNPATPGARNGERRILLLQDCSNAPHGTPVAWGVCAAGFLGFFPKS